jgi:Prokaryotic metallothionein
LLLRLVVIFLICYILVSVVKAIGRTGKTKAPKPRNFNNEGEEMVFDPQCQSYVPKSDAVVVSGKYFCSQACARLYLSR